MSFELSVDRDMQGKPHPYLSAATRKASEAGSPLTLSLENWRGFEGAQRSIRISQKVTDLLRLIAARTKTPGECWEIDLQKDYPLIAAANSVELANLSDHLHMRGWLEGGTTICRLTVPGWEALEPLPRLGGIPGQCFVAMWFSDQTRAAYESGIEPAVRDAGFTPTRIDKKEHNNEIPDEIIAEIRNCQFMVADFTGQRAGVYYEAGFAMGLGRPVIWCCRKDELDKLHFDTNHKNHIDWGSVEELRERLYRRIRATILEQG
jgi:nucleoside 2-deoxyribosyltransferase